MTQDTTVPEPLVLDVDLAGRVLSRTRQQPHQLIEYGRKGKPRRLTSLDTACTGLYIPGHRAVIVQHDWGRNTSDQLSLLNLVATQLPSGLEGFHLLAHGAGVTHQLLHVHDRGIVYATNDDDRSRMDVWYRAWRGGPTMLQRGVSVPCQAITSKDGQTIVVWSPSAPTLTLHRLPRSERETIELPAGNTVTSIRPNIDGTRMVITYQRADSSYGTWWWDGERRFREIHPPTGQMIRGGVSPDATHAVCVDIAGSQILVLSLDGDEVLRHRCSITHRPMRVAWNITGDICAVDTGQDLWRWRLSDGKISVLH